MRSNDFLIDKNQILYIYPFLPISSIIKHEIILHHSPPISAIHHHFRDLTKFQIWLQDFRAASANQRSQTPSEASWHRSGLQRGNGLGSTVTG